MFRSLVSAPIVLQARGATVWVVFFGGVELLRHKVPEFGVSLALLTKSLLWDVSTDRKKAAVSLRVKMTGDVLWFGLSCELLFCVKSILDH